MSEKRFKITIEDRETKGEYDLEYDFLDIKQDAGVSFNKDGLLEKNGMFRLEIKAWSGMEEFCFFKTVGNKVIE